MTTEEWNEVFPIIPTAQEFWEEFDENFEMMDPNTIFWKMAEFAKFHVEKALETAAIASFDENNHYIERELYDKEAIINSYPLTNIK